MNYLQINERSGEPENEKWLEISRLTLTGGLATR